MNAHMKFLQALVTSIALSTAILALYEFAAPHDIELGLLGLGVAGLFYIAKLMIVADDRAERRSAELNAKIDQWLESQKAAELRAARVEAAGPFRIMDGPPLLPKRAPLVPGRRFPIQTLNGDLKVEVAA